MKPSKKIKIQRANKRKGRKNEKRKYIDDNNIEIGWMKERKKEKEQRGEESKKAINEKIEKYMDNT